jgi:hypothetical protein
VKLRDADRNVCLVDQDEPTILLDCSSNRRIFTRNKPPDNSGQPFDLKLDPLEEF